MNTDHRQPARRQFLRRALRGSLHGAATLVVAGSLPAVAATSPPMPRGARALSFAHVHTGETLSVVYAADGQYLPEALQALGRLLRDHYSGSVGAIDPALFDQLHALREVLGCTRPFEVISGYRCAATNERLRTSRGGGVARRSLHMDGRAIDIRLPGVALADLRDAALGLRAGGVGYYAQERFVHLDTGRVRHW